MKKFIKFMGLLMIACIAILALTGCAENTEKVVSSNPLVGSWKNEYLGYDFIYTFNADGTGKYDAAGTNMPFTYTTEGNQISILYDGDSASFDTEYSIDGSTLNVIDSLGNDTLYQRVK